MVDFTVTNYNDIVNALASANANTSSDNLRFANDIILTADQMINLQTMAGSGNLRFREPLNSGATPSLIVQSALNINDNDPSTAQPSFAIGALRLQIGNGGTAGSIAGNLRLDDGGNLVFDRSVDTTYTGTLSIEDSPNSLINLVAGTTVTLDGTAGTNGLAIRASQGTGAANAFELEFGGAGDGIISGNIADGGIAARPGNFTKTGDGTWTFSGANTYAGSTTVAGGTLKVTSATGLGAIIGSGTGATAARAGTSVRSGATLALQAGNGNGISIGAEALSLAGLGFNGGGALRNLGGNNSFGGDITLTADAFVASDSGRLTLGGSVAGAFGLTLGGAGNGRITGAIQSSVTTVTKQGSGSWALSGNNAYAGGTSLNGGTLDIGTLNSVGTGAVTFGIGAQTLQVDVAGTLNNTISGFGVGDVLDLTTIDSNGATFSLQNGVLTVMESATVGTDSNAFNIGAPQSGYRYVLGSDGSGGTTVMLQDAVAPDTPGAPSLTAASDSGASNNDGLTNVRRPSFSGTAEAGSTVTLYEGTSVLGSATVDASGNYTVMSSVSLGDGLHTVNVTATDAAGNTSSGSAGTTIMIDATAPGMPDAPALLRSSDTGAADGITADTTPTFSGTAEAGSTVSLYEGTTLLGSAVADSNGRYVVESGTALADGDHTLQVAATDAAGNTSAASSGTTVTIDTSAPDAPSAPTLTAGSDTGTPNDGTTRVKMPSFAGMAEAGSTVTLFEGNAVLGTATADADGAYLVSSSVALADGSHTFTVTATDAAGNTGNTSAATTVTIDTVAPATPAAPVLARSSDTGAADGITSDATPTFSGRAEAGSTVTLYDVTSKVIGAPVIGTAVVNDDGTWSITAAQLSEGVHGIRVRSTDVAGNISGYSGSTRVVIDTTAPGTPSAPSLTAASDSGARNDSLTRDTTPTFTGSADAQTTVRLYDGDTLVGTARAGSSGTYTITASRLGDGNHTLTTKSTDTAGNESAASNGTSLTIDATAPTRPNVPTLDAASDTGVSSTDGITSDTTPTFTGTGAAGDTVTLYEGTRATGSIVVGSDGTWSIPTGNLADGAHVFRTRESDAAGNFSAFSSGRRVVVDTQDPDVDITTPDGTYTSARQTVSGTGEAGSRITLADDDTDIVYGSTIVRADGTWSRTVTLEEGENDIGATAVDKAGNVATSDEIALIYQPAGARTAAFAAPQAASADPGLTSALFNAAFAPSFVAEAASMPHADLAAAHLVSPAA